MTNVQTTGEASNPPKRTYSTRKHYYQTFLHCFLFCGFLPTWIQIRIPDADLDPPTKISADPCGTGFPNCFVHNIFFNNSRISSHIKLKLFFFSRHCVGMLTDDILVFNIEPALRHQ